MSLLRIVHLGPNGAVFDRGFLVRTKWLRVFLHRFLMSDPDEEFHSHPFKWSFSLILSGYYIEDRLVDGKVVTKLYGPGDINVIRSTDFHSVTLASDDVFTVFIAGPKVSEWGFKHPKTGVYETADDFWKRKGIKPSQDTTDID